jgi:hypothetical protein
MRFSHLGHVKITSTLDCLPASRYEPRQDVALQNASGAGPERLIRKPRIAQHFGSEVQATPFSIGLRPTAESSLTSNRCTSGTTQPINGDMQHGHPEFWPCNPPAFQAPSRRCPPRVHPSCPAPCDSTATWLGWTDPGLVAARSLPHRLDGMMTMRSRRCGYNTRTYPTTMNSI